MRNLEVTPLKILALVVVGAVVWLLTSLLDPNQERVQVLALGDLDAALFSGDDALIPKAGFEASGINRVGWLPACARALDAKIDARVTVTPAGPGVLTLGCRVVDGRVAVSVSRPGDADAAAPNTLLARIPDSTSLLPPLLGILFALIFRKVLLALLAAVAFGALLKDEGDIIAATATTASDYLWGSVADMGNLYILGFTVLLVGMVHICIRMGGMRGIVDALSRIATGRRSAQVATGAMGLAVFFDDYANTVVVGSSVQSLTDKFKISREKLAYIVDSTAAPVAGIAVISTWIGFEISVFQEQMELGYLTNLAGNGYDFFFTILPYRFYCVLSLGLVFIIASTGRDFGPMLKAERRAYRLGQVRRPDTGTAEARAGTPMETTIKDGAPPRWANGVLPIVAVIVGTFAASIIVGREVLDAKNPAWDADLGFFGALQDAFIAASDYTIEILFWASFGGAAVAFLLALGQRILNANEAGRAFFNGLWGVAPVLAILVLAIALRKVTGDLGTDKYLVALVGDVPAWILPVTIFGLAAFIAFATGSSWGTMGILIPVAIPLVVAVASTHPNGDLITLLAAAAVLDGAIFGDHCSLISDTTIMSSLATGCDHVDHVRTQLPYALLAMLTAAGLGYTLLAWSSVEIPVVVVYLGGILAMLLWVRLRGKSVADGA